MSSLLSGSMNFFGLDIGTTAIRLVELRGGSGGPKALVKYAYLPIQGNVAISESKGDKQKLSQLIAQLVNQAGVSTRNVSVGVPSSRVFTTIADFDRLSPSDLKKSIPLQADALIPTPLAESKLDSVVLGDSPVYKG